MLIIGVNYSGVFPIQSFC